MPEYTYPGVYIQEIPAGVKPIEGVATSTAAFIGATYSGPVDHASDVLTSLVEFERDYGDGTDLIFSDGTRQTNWMWHSVRAFFANGGQRLHVSRAGDGRGTLPDTAAFLAALALIDNINGISIVSAPGLIAGTRQVPVPDVQARGGALLRHAELHRCFAVIDCAEQQSIADVLSLRAQFDSGYGALYYPWVAVTDAASGRVRHVPPSGFVAGIYARVDANRGVHKAPADEVVQLATGLERDVTRAEQDVLNPAGVNCLRSFPGRGVLVWGARTLSHDPEWKYVSIRRLFTYLEQSIDRGTQWAVFEPNGDRLWLAIRGQIQNFLRTVWRSGALAGRTEDEAFFVRCDRTTMTQDDIDRGRMICLIGVAVVRPAEFVIFRIRQQTAAG